MSVVLASIPQPPNKVQEYWGDRPMGEVRVKVKFTNVADAAAAAHGMIAADEIRIYEADAMVDTGSATTVIPQAVCDSLGVDLLGMRRVEFAAGRSEDVAVTFPLIMELMGRKTSDECVVLGNEVLIGQTVLEKTDLLVDCSHGKLVANPAHPDQPILKVK